MNSRFAQLVGLGPGEAETLATLDGLVGRLAEQTADPRAWRSDGKRRPLTATLGQEKRFRSCGRCRASSSDSAAGLR